MIEREAIPLPCNGLPCRQFTPFVYHAAL